MKGVWLWLASFFSVAAALIAGYASWRFVPLVLWSPILSSLLTALVLMAGAVLVRLARNSPFTSPVIFDEEDLQRFFDALEKLSARLLGIFFQIIFSIFIIILSIFIINFKQKVGFVDDYVGPFISGVLSGSLVWLVFRLILMARGDIGFIRLQRIIMENALSRSKSIEVSKVVDQPVRMRSPGDFGRRL